MPLIFRFFFIFMIAMTAFSCGKEDSMRDQNKVDAGNFKLARMEEIRYELARQHLNLSAPKHEDADRAVEQMEPVIRDATKSKLRSCHVLALEYHSLGEEVLALIASKEVTYGGDVRVLRRRVRMAQLLAERIAEAL